MPLRVLSSSSLLSIQISAVSPKAQTTRENVIGIANIENTQLIFTDTPGIVDRSKTKKYVAIDPLGVIEVRLIPVLG